MKIAKYLYMATATLAMAIALALGSCSGAEVENGVQQQGLMPVLFSAGNMEAVVTRASAAYMPEGSYFACKMFFHAGASDTDSTKFYTDDNKLTVDVNMATAQLQIDNETGNAAYQGNTFYWQNRMDHVFLALADNNRLTDKPVFTDDLIEFDLTRGDKTSMAEQPDPILAYVKTKPAGATPEANRVKLYFKHQFAQVQVNLKNAQDESVNLKDTTFIDNVELLGVSKTGTVPFSIKPNGDVPGTTSKAEGKDYAFSLFDCKTPTAGYLRTYEGIAFGTMQGIQVTWHEADTNIEHKAILKSTINAKLESGKKYIYNIELRRSVIAQVVAEIADWEVDENKYDASGTIVN